MIVKHGPPFLPYLLQVQVLDGAATGEEGKQEELDDVKRGEGGDTNEEAGDAGDVKAGEKKVENGEGAKDGDDGSAAAGAGEEEGDSKSKVEGGDPLDVKKGKDSADDDAIRIGDGETPGVGGNSPKGTSSQKGEDIASVGASSVGSGAGGDESKADAAVVT